MNYYNALIEVAEDSPAAVARVPQARGGRKTKAVIEYELLAKHPYTYTEEDIASRYTRTCTTSRKRTGK
jgi:Family of unknown function (DUF6157)